MNCQMCGVQMTPESNCGGDCAWCLADDDPHAAAYAATHVKPGTVYGFDLSVDGMPEAVERVRAAACKELAAILHEEAKELELVRGGLPVTDLAWIRPLTSIRGTITIRKAP